jgi:ArsR family transcriptional regulator
MNEFIKVMKALSDPNRVKLLKLLQKREMCVCEIQAALGISQPTVSKHLKILEGAGLEAFMMLREYARQHVLTCLIPAFFIAGAIVVLLSTAAGMAYGWFVV